MPFHRLGLILFSLFLSACTLIPTEQSSSAKVDHQTTDDQPTTIVVEQIKQNTAKNEERASQSPSSPLDTLPKPDLTSQQTEQLANLQKRAQEQYSQLTHTLGQDYAKAPPATSIVINKDNYQAQLDALTSYLSEANNDIKALQLRTKLRDNEPAVGDRIQLFIENAHVEHPSQSFAAQSIVGQWLRGGSREVRLTNNFLLEAPKSEQLHISFNEAYQIIFNGQPVFVVSPSQAEGQGHFIIDSLDKTGQISGQFSYRVIKQ